MAQEKDAPCAEECSRKNRGCIAAVPSRLQPLNDKLEETEKMTEWTEENGQESRTELESGYLLVTFDAYQ